MGWKRSRMSLERKRVPRVVVAATKAISGMMMITMTLSSVAVGVFVCFFNTAVTAFSFVGHETALAVIPSRRSSMGSSGRMTGAATASAFDEELSIEEDKQQQKEDEERISNRFLIHQNQRPILDTTHQHDLSLSSSSFPSSLPPWLQLQHQRTEEELDQDIAWLEYGMLEKGFPLTSVQEIVHCIQKTAAGANVTKMAGIVDFLRLILQMPLDELQTQNFITREVLLASILHYDECLTARERGVYDWIQDAIQSRRRHAAVADQAITTIRTLPTDKRQVSITIHPFSTGSDSVVTDVFKSLPLVFPAKPCELIHVGVCSEDQLLPWDDDEVRRLAQGAARIKRAEILAHTVLGASRLSSKEESSRVRGLLLSVMDDWRALALRCVACLYRLEGILYDWEHGKAQYLERTPEVIRTAKDALTVYATLSQRLGMHGLKAQLEDRAFRILYRRQYQAVSTLYRQTGGVMQSVASYMTSQITQVLRCDQALMAQLDMVQVCARVKEPFSFWKKMLKVSGTGAKKGMLQQGSSSSLSVTNVPDGVALRVILQARKWTPEETDDMTRARERLLCYYVQHLIRSRWPAVDPSRIKDYIQHPKANGYRSLHFTSSISCRGQEFPFEIQVRSEEMHRSAEFGIAAHWDYKLGSSSTSKSGQVVTTTVMDAKEGNDNNDMLKSGVLAVSSHSSRRRGGTEIQTALLNEEELHSLNRSYIDALVNSKQALVEQSVYAFFTGSFLKEQGSLVALPAGARIGDGLTTLRQTESSSHDKNGNLLVWRNGKLATMLDRIHNGDVIMIDAIS